MTALTDKKEVVVVTTTDNYSVVVHSPDTLVVDSQSIQVVVESETGNVVVQETVQELVVTAPGGQGPPGAPGASTQFEYHPAGVILGGNRAVTLNSSGQFVYPDTTSPNSFVVGITTASSVVGALATVQIAGTQQEPSWNWTPGLPVFVGLLGVLTQVPPTTGQVLAVGYATSSTKIHIDKQPPIFME